MTAQQPPRAGLVTHRFDAAANVATRDRPAAGVTRFCLYAVQDSAPDRLAWYETGDYLAPDATAAWSDGAAAVERLSFRLHRAAQSSSGRLEDCRWLYVVHTDIPDDVSQEYNTWYDEEHLPRLVQVPGIVRARRYVAPDQVRPCVAPDQARPCVAPDQARPCIAPDRAPRYLTAYELSDPEAFSSPAGLLARKTPWTARMRALFFNTRRYTARLLQTT